jgi:hypothetical protein
MSNTKLHNEQAVCPNCGSLYFHRAEFKRYRGGMTSSSPGGDLSEISQAMTARICICGHTEADVPGMSHSPQERRRFAQSVAAALAYRHRSDSRRIAIELAEGLASREDLQAVNERIKRLEMVIDLARKERMRA